MDPIQFGKTDIEENDVRLILFGFPNSLQTSGCLAHYNHIGLCVNQPTQSPPDQPMVVDDQYAYWSQSVLL